MNKFNICKNYVTRLYDMPIAKGALYGKDKAGVWVCTHKQLYPFDKPTLELYRWNNEEMGWVLTIEQSATTAYIADCATRFNLWDIPVEYPRLTGLHSISANMDKTTSRKKCNSLKNVNNRHQNRHDKDFFALDYAEKVMCKVR